MDAAIFEQHYPVSQVISAVAAAATAQRLRLPADARCDLRQELMLELWQKRHAFNPERGGWRTFSKAVVKNRARDLSRQMCAARSAVFKEAPIEHARYVPTPDEAWDVRIDVLRVLAGVSPADRRIACTLAYLNPTQTSRLTGVPRGQVYRAIVRLRVAFYAAGFGGGQHASSCLGSRKTT